jgi:hypothetical protein
VVHSNEQGPPTGRTESDRDHAGRRLEEEINSRFGDARSAESTEAERPDAPAQDRAESKDAERPDADAQDVSEATADPHDDE